MEQVGAQPPWAVTSGYWLEELPPETLALAGEYTLALLVDAHRWIHRRVERVELLDDRVARHRVSLDFSLPDNTPRVAEWNHTPVFLAPLFFLPKDHPNREQNERSVRAVYSAVDLVAAEGTSLPLITRHEGSTIAGAALHAQARRILGPDIDEDLKESIFRIAVLDSLYDGTPALHYVMEEQCNKEDPRTKLRGDPTFTELAYAFALHWLVVEPIISPHPPERSIVKFAYNKLSQAERGPIHVQIRRALGWKSTVFWTRLTQIGAAASYHLEITAPPELEMTEMGLFGQRYKLGWRGVREPSQMRRPDPKNQYIRQVECTTEGHVYLPDNPDRRVGAAWVKLRVRRLGFLNAALLAAMVISFILFVYAGNAEDIIHATQLGGSSSAVTVLLLLPTILAAFIARPGEHAMTANMLRVLRLLLVADGGLSFIAAIVLLRTRANPTPHDLHDLIDWLNWLARGSLVFVVLFLLSNVFPQPHDVWIYSLGAETEDTDAPTGRTPLIFGRLLPRSMSDEPYITTLRKWQRDKGRILPASKPDEAYLMTLFRSRPDCATSSETSQTEEIEGQG